MAVAFGSSALTTSGTGPSSINLTVPASVASNDIVIAWLQANNNFGSGQTDLPAMTVTSVPSGFSLIPGFTSSGIVSRGSPTDAQASGLWGYWKRATAEDAGLYTFGFSDSTSYRGGLVARYTGCVTTGDPFDTAKSSNTNVNSLTAPAVSLTTSTTNEMLLWVGSSYSGYRLTTQPSGFTSNAQGVNNDSDCGWQLSSKAAASAAATGSLTGTWGSSHYGSTVAWLGALLSTAIPGAPANTNKFFYGL